VVVRVVLETHKLKVQTVDRVVVLAIQLLELELVVKDLAGEQIHQTLVIMLAVEAVLVQLAEMQFHLNLVMEVLVLQHQLLGRLHIMAAAEEEVVKLLLVQVV
jgi:hypothetical protein